MPKSLFIPALLGVLYLTVLATVLPPTPPPGPIGPYLNGIFPPTPPGANNSWELQDAWPEISIASPLRVVEFPGSEDVLVVSKVGEVWRVSLEDQTQELVLNIRDRSFKRGEAGTTGIALHPEFGNPAAPDNQWMFVFYRTKPEPDEWDEKGFNRLSKFTWDAGRQEFDADSEEILFQQYDRFTWHNGGGMFFGMDGFLYVALGDEGAFEMASVSSQRLDGGFFSGILRIDVDNDMSRSHPIRRQPTVSAQAPPAGWGETYSQGYSIPNDNPWLSPDSSHLEEFYAIGCRSPFSTTQDPATGMIWVADVGSDKREEISRVSKGDNLQWPYMEGNFDMEEHDRPADLIGVDRPPLFDYGRNFGNCIIGGAVYNGNLYPDLIGSYLFGEYTRGTIMALYNHQTGSEPKVKVLLSDLEGSGIDLPPDPGISGIFPLSNGEIIVTILSFSDFERPGKVLRLSAREVVPDPPALLSELDVFSDLQDLTVSPGIIPYSVNAPLWSDRAVKKRWIALPNDGDFDASDEQINFSSRSDWSFPEGTVFIKHFDLPLTDEPGGEVIRLETRFFIVGKDGRSYGVTYQWNEEGTDATLLGSAATRDIDVDVMGESFTQTWEFPSRTQCLTCHTANAGYVLGVKTHQLNGDLFYPELGETMNQLEYLGDIGAFRQSIGDPGDHPRAARIDDDEAGLELRIRSYLDANCASCHRLGGVPQLTLDFRFGTPLQLNNLINQPTQSSNSDPDLLIVEPGNHATSEIWIRDASNTEDKMPPLGRRHVDQVYVDALAEWIDGLPEDAGMVRELLVYPNPSSGWVALRISDEWEGPFSVRVYAMTGQFIREEEFNNRTYSLDLTQDPAGPYLLEVGSGAHSEIRKVIVN